MRFHGGLTRKGEGIHKSTQEGTATRNVCIILASQKMIHYAIATYGALTQLSKTLGWIKWQDILYLTLAKE